MKVKRQQDCELIQAKVLTMGVELNELKVFISWFNDNINYSAAPSILAKRLNIKEDAVRKAIKGLVAKDILTPDGTKLVQTEGGMQNMNVYRLSNTLLAEAKASPLDTDKASPLDDEWGPLSMGSIPANREPANLLPAKENSDVKGRKVLRALSEQERKERDRLEREVEESAAFIDTDLPFNFSL